VRDLSAQPVTVVSGLAFGIDAIAHKAALANGLSTIGLLAHGLDQVYPVEHSYLARDMIKNNGGILSEFRRRTKPDKHNFPSRNRIVAGMSDATIVIETDIKGGSMITAELANGYNKDVFAIPARINDNKSAGCNFLVRTNKAMLLTEATEIMETMGWALPRDKKKAILNKQKALFIELSPEEKVIIGLLEEKETVPIDELNNKSGLSSSRVAASILNLELQNVIVSLPGKLYRLA